jgi:hypothetical protein
MNLHKLIVELFELSNENHYKIGDILELMREARNDFEMVGVPFTYDNFKEYAKRYYSKLRSSNTTELLKIIEGDNLDIIEEEAKKKGLM